MAYTTTSDVQVRLMRSLTPEEDAAATAWIGDLEADIALRVPDTAAVAAIIRRVVSQAVIRVLNNPAGLRQRSVTVDDYTRTETVDSAGSAGMLYLTDEEWSLLLPGTSGEVFTISPYGAP